MMGNIQEEISKPNNGTYNMCCTYLKHTKKYLFDEWMNLSREERRHVQDILNKTNADVLRILREARCK